MLQSCATIPRTCKPWMQQLLGLVMAFQVCCGPSQAGRHVLRPRPFPVPMNCHVNGQLIPVVCTYTYHGVVFHDSLNWRHHILVRGERRMAGCRPHAFLGQLHTQITCQYTFSRGYSVHVFNRWFVSALNSLPIPVIYSVSVHA